MRRPPLPAGRGFFVACALVMALPSCRKCAQYPLSIAWGGGHRPLPIAGKGDEQGISQHSGHPLCVPQRDERAHSQSAGGDRAAMLTLIAARRLARACEPRGIRGVESKYNVVKYELLRIFVPRSHAVARQLPLGRGATISTAYSYPSVAARRRFKLPLLLRKKNFLTKCLSAFKGRYN